jgi:hypothetical protein
VQREQQLNTHYLPSMHPLTITARKYNNYLPTLRLCVRETQRVVLEEVTALII